MERKWRGRIREKKKRKKKKEGRSVAPKRCERHVRLNRSISLVRLAIMRSCAYACALLTLGSEVKRRD